MSYPDWVLSHKTKGTEIHVVNGKYYLYAVHSERDKTTKKIKKITDKYLGRITEEGLLPPKPKPFNNIVVLEYGLSYSLSILFENIRTGLRKLHPNDYDLIFFSSLLFIIHKEYSHSLFQKCYFSIVYPDLNLDCPKSKMIENEINRCIAMMNEYCKKIFKTIDNQKRFFTECSSVYQVFINNVWYLSKVSKPVLTLLQEYHISLGGKDNEVY